MKLFRYDFEDGQTVCFPINKFESASIIYKREFATRCCHLSYIIHINGSEFTVDTGTDIGTVFVCEVVLNIGADIGVLLMCEVALDTGRVLDIGTVLVCVAA